MVIRGQIEPPLHNARVIASQINANNETEIVEQGISDASGGYKIGPMPPNPASKEENQMSTAGYTVTVEKEDYKFTAIEPQTLYGAKRVPYIKPIFYD